MQGNTEALLKQLQDKVQYLSDCEEIRQAIYRYARGVDRVDEKLLRQSYYPDAYDNHNSFKGTGTEAVEILMRNGRSGRASASNHHIGNILIDLRGDVAHVETYFVAFQRQEKEGKTYTRTRTGRYLDRFERRNGEWRVMSRTLADDWSRLDEVVATAPEVPPTSAFGKRDETDPSYGIKGFLDRWRK